MDRLDVVNTIWFAGWLIAVAVLFALGLRLPLMPRLRRLPALAYAGAIVVATLGLAALANVALVLHDVHFDLTREGVFTPSKQAETVVDRLRQDVKLTYFYQAQDQAGRRARDMVEVLGRRNPRLRVRTVDPDKQPTVADTYGVRIYNAAVLETDGRRIQVMSTDENQIALGILRVIREQVTTVCFIEGHDEYPMENFEFHTHFEGVAGHGHGEGASALVQMRAHGAGRLRRALESLGYDVRKIIPATSTAIPADCAVVVDVNPRTTYLPGESELLVGYLARGGSALLMYDLGFVLEPRLAAALRNGGRRRRAGRRDRPARSLLHGSGGRRGARVRAAPDHPERRAHVLPGRSLADAASPAARRHERAALSQQHRELHAPGAGGVGAPARRRCRDGARRPRPRPGTGRRVLAAAIEGTWPGARPAARPFRLVVVGDGDFASNSFLPYMANSDLALAMVRWLVREERTPSVTVRMPVPPLVLLTKSQMQRIFLVIEVLLPLGVVAVGAVVWWRRR